MLMLICGRSKAGKTTYSKRYNDVIHLDDAMKKGFNVYDITHDAVSRRTGDVVVEGIYATVKRRKALINAYKGSGIKICIWLDTPKSIIAARGLFKTVCPEEFEPPSRSEGWDEIIIIRGEYEQRISRQTED